MICKFTITVSIISLWRCWANFRHWMFLCWSFGAPLGSVGWRKWCNVSFCLLLYKQLCSVSQASSLLSSNSLIDPVMFTHTYRDRKRERETCVRYDSLYHLLRWNRGLLQLWCAVSVLLSELNWSIAQKLSQQTDRTELVFYLLDLKGHTHVCASVIHVETSRWVPGSGVFGCPETCWWWTLKRGIQKRPKGWEEDKTEHNKPAEERQVRFTL